MKKASLYTKKEKNIVQCLACSHYCMIPLGKRGICGVRENRNGDLFLRVYGKVAALNIDPIEKKPLYHFFPGTNVLSLGTVGCNFRCTFCQNATISQKMKSALAGKNDKDRMLKYVEENDIGKNMSPKDIVSLALENNIPSIAYTYNEPAIFFEYAYDISQLAHKKGIKNIFVSNGYESKEALEKIHPYLDAINIDLKAFTEHFYQQYCGAKLQPVLDTIKRCKKYGIWQEITTLIIPTLNDSDKELKAVAEFIASVDTNIPWHISRFFPAYKMMNIAPTPLETLEKAYRIGKKAGLRYVYIGNVQTEKYESTFCKKCGEILIDRVGYEIKILYEKKGECRKCGEKLEGRF